jgi:hyperosmotically inducible periplasmic protein
MIQTESQDPDGPTNYKRRFTMRGRTLIIGTVVGALTAYFLDPNTGKRRRHITRDKAGSLLNKTSRSAQHTAEHAGGQLQGVLRETVPHRSDNPNPDDNTLRDRVESEVFRDPRYSREHVNVEVAEGVVDIHGQLPSQAEIDDLVLRVKNVPDVKGVQTYLHLPGTPAPNKKDSLQVGS